MACESVPTCGNGGRALDTVVEDGGDVVGVDESARCDEARQEGIDVVMVGLGTAEFSREQAERLDFDRALGLFVRGEMELRMRVAQRSCWAAAAVSYCGGELLIEPHCSCSSHDGLVRERASTAMLQKPVEHVASPRGGTQFVTRVRLRVVGRRGRESL